MPIYEYSCTNCHHQFECMQKMSDEPIRVCPQCSQATVEKLVSAAGFQLKGTGWYATDFKDKPQQKASADKSAGATDSGATAASKPSKD